MLTIFDPRPLWGGQVGAACAGVDSPGGSGPGGGEWGGGPLNVHVDQNLKKSTYFKKYFIPLCNSFAYYIELKSIEF